MELLLTGDPISAERAYQLGMVNQLVEGGEAMAAAQTMAARITVNAPVAVRESRQVALAALNRADDELWKMSAEERVAAMWRGELTWGQLFEWARVAKHEVPLIDGEFAFIAAYTPEVAEAKKPKQ